MEKRRIARALIPCFPIWRDLVAIRLVKSTSSVLYDNIRLIIGHDLNPNPANGQDLTNGGNVTLGWTNLPPNAPATSTPVDVWFGGNPAALTQVVDGQILSSTVVNVPTAGNWYWRVDSYPDGNPNGTPVTGQIFVFTIADTDGDGLPDAYESANTNPSSNTAMNPGDNPDADGLTNLQEFQYGTNPGVADTDGDTLNDGPEIYGTAGSRPATNPLLFDTDGDGPGDGVETNTGVWVSAADTGTNPVDKDWDKDGLPDGVETKDGTFNSRTTDTGTDPYLADTDGDGAGDWYEVAGTLTDPNSGAAGQTSSIPYPLPDPDPADLGDATKPVKVYIMAGQSNTVGIGYVNGGNGSLDTITKIDNKFPNLIDASKAWTKRNDVIYKGVVSATAQGPLTAGQGADGTRVGPELGFGQVMGWYHNEPVLIIKASQGNRSLGWDFLPPGGNRWTVGDRSYAAYGESPQSWLTASGATAPGGWYAGKQYDDCFRAESAMGMISWSSGTVYAKDVLIKHNGAAYQCTVAHTGGSSTEPGVGASWLSNWKLHTITNAADLLDFTTGKLKNLPTTGNNLNGRDFEIAGFCWWQGHKDHTDAIYAPRYEQHLVKLINALRADFQAPNAPVVVASIGFGGGDISSKPALYQAVYNAQMAVGNPALHPAFGGTVKSVNTLPYWRTLAESPGQQDFHYNNNAETYTLVGDAMARAMLSMQDDTAPPSPSPLTFAIAPTALNPTTVGMVATTANDVSGPVEYFFENQTTGNNSGWITGTRWDNTGLTTGESCDYRVKARDAKGNEGTWSATSSATPATDTTAPSSATTLAPDTTPPTPATMSFATAPAAIGTNAISMTATTATDPSGVEYFFEAVGGGTSGGWQNSPTYTDSSLSPGTEYGYRVRARDKSPARNTTTWSEVLTATTKVPDTTSPLALSFNPANASSNVAINSNLVITFDEEITQGTGLITIKNPTDTTQTIISITDGTQVSASGAVLTINPTANLLHGKNYAIRIASGAIEDLSDNPFAGITNDTTWSFSTAVPPVTPLAVIHEPFGQTAGALNGKAAGATGLSGNWTAASAAGAVSVVNPPTIASFGDLPNTGGQVNLPSSASTYAFVTPASALADAGLLNDGATLWFSYVFQKTANGGSNEHSGFALGTNRLNPAFNGLLMDGSGYGLGVYTNASGVVASSWAAGTRTGGTSSNLQALSTPTLVIGKIVWGANPTANETITIYTRALNAISTEPISGGGTRSVAGFDQSALDTISFGQRNSGGTHTYDEIRFGSTYGSVIGQGNPGPGPVATFEISPITSPRTVGTPITGITITAKDASNHTATGFTGTVTFGGTGGFSGTTAAFAAGVLTGVSVTPTVAGENLTLTVSNGAGQSGTTTISTIRTQYAAWSNNAAFGADANGDGIDNGMAWLLGATNPASNATGLLPKVSKSTTRVGLEFRCLKAAKRGSTKLFVQHGGNLEGGASWTSVAVPETDGTVGVVGFTVIPDGDFNKVTASIPLGDPAADTYFARLMATE